MTDINQLRDAVIEAARVVSWNYPGGAQPSCNATLRDALAALDKAEKPDPWALLREARDSLPMYGPTCRITQRVDAALAWKEQNDG